MQREIMNVREELGIYSVKYEKIGNQINEVKANIQEYENRLRYGNEII
jgi:uncharacterized protein YaaN involved in tellurite resistance